ncbi:MAG TPA: hypothetical protein VFK00_08355 [Rhodanobacteraceae bacterium]|jgi:hypothetical protein|nr:hypothetical protein [Rhodanobacteraceae bacterium]
MTTRHRHVWLHVALLALAAGFGTGSARALTLHQLKGAQLDSIYGTYAPRSDCQREPRITVDDSGFTYHYRGHTSHPTTFEYALTYMGQDYQGIGQWFFPFPVNESDFGRVLMTINPDEKAGTLKFEPNVAPGESLTPLQAALVKGSPYAKCAKPIATSGVAPRAARQGAVP